MSEFASALHDPLSDWLTPLEAAEFQRFSRSQEITDYLYTLAASSALARVDIWGYSVTGKPLTALRIAAPPNDVSRLRIRVLLVGSQHGASEAAGGEALMVVARQLLHGDLQPLLQDMEVYLLPNANPDGRNADSSKNANEVNLNRDYVLLSQPESRALDQALARIQPHVVLDAHESAALKRKSLGLEGYMTEFQAQMDVANNPAISKPVQDFCEHAVMRPVLEAIGAGGMHAQRYIKEIGSTRQPLTHGGVTARMFRNKAGLCGALSFLLETRMEPKDGCYPSFRNIRVRRSRQLFCIRLFLAHIARQTRDIINICATHGNSRSAPHCVLNADFVEHPHEPVTRLPLRSIATQVVTEIEFVNHRHMRLHAPMPRPDAYYITRHTALFAHLLQRHSLQFEWFSQAQAVDVVALRFRHLGDQPEDDIEIETADMTLQVAPGCLYIPADQTRGLLLPQLLEPQSTSSFFRYARFRALCRVDETFFIYRRYS